MRIHQIKGGGEHCACGHTGEGVFTYARIVVYHARRPTIIKGCLSCGKCILDTDIWSVAASTALPIAESMDEFEKFAASLDAEAEADEEADEQWVQWVRQQRGRNQ